MWTPTALGSERRPLEGDIWRVVEAQHRITTTRLVDSMAELDELEAILEQTKPPYPAGTEGLDYLLKTPFRYEPPNPHGSRFRRPFTAGVFYAAELRETALAETAFHRLRFFDASVDVQLPRAAVPLTLFMVSYQTGHGLDLTAPELNRNREQWTDSVHYDACQALADTAREINSEALRYESARDPERRSNVALLSPSAFTVSAPATQQTWHCSVKAGEVFFLRDREEQCSFARSLFEIDGTLQAPY